MKLTGIVLSAFISVSHLPSMAKILTSARTPFQRADQGAPITVQEREKATDEFIALLKDTRYLDFINSRVHGVPEGNRAGHFWWANMWTGVKVAKKDGRVFFTHQNNGSDNIGIHTAPHLEGACYAYRMTGDPRYEKLARKLIRGFSSWILSGMKAASDPSRILSRSFYPASFESLEAGRSLSVNYEASRPGIKTDASDYVHINGNPYFGDLWVKNNRSIDDIGQMIRAMSQVQVCKDIFSSETRADLEQMNSLYAGWAEHVERSKFIIPTYNKNAEAVIIKNGIGDFDAFAYLGFDPNCAGKMAIRFLYDASPRGFSCGNGMSAMEKMFDKKLSNDVVEILRSHHISSIAMAELRGHQDLALALREGLTRRLERDMGVVADPQGYPQMDIQDIPAELVHANNVGVPLTSHEIRFLYERLHQAYVGMRSPQFFSTFHLFEPVVPDGEYAYDAPGIGLYYYTLAPMIGACSSAWSQPTVRPWLNCERVKAALLL